MWILLNSGLICLTSKWKLVGIGLGIPYDQLKDLESKYDNYDCLQRVLDMWFNGHGNAQTWETLINVLRSSAINESKLADKIEREYVDDSSKGVFFFCTEYATCKYIFVLQTSQRVQMLNQGILISLPRKLANQCHLVCLYISIDLAN